MNLYEKLVEIREPSTKDEVWDFGVLVPAAGGVPAGHHGDRVEEQLQTILEASRTHIQLQAVVLGVGVFVEHIREAIGAGDGLVGGKGSIILIHEEAG